MILATETVYRGFKRTRFSKRGRWNMIICGLAVLVASILSWIPTIGRKRTDAVCMADFIMFAAHWADVGLGINIGLIAGYCMLGSILAVQLIRASRLERDERIAASRVVYYLAIGVVLMVSLISIPQLCLFLLTSSRGYCCLFGLGLLSLVIHQSHG